MGQVGEGLFKAEGQRVPRSWGQGMFSVFQVQQGSPWYDGGQLGELGLHVTQSVYSQDTAMHAHRSDHRH